jgi:paraquat-inducible protein B
VSDPPPIEPTPPATPPVVFPEFRASQRWNLVWLVPVIAILIGGWLVYRNISSKGPLAVVRFETADGIAAGRTEVRCRSVRVGVVVNVELAKDLGSVLVHVRIDPQSAQLLRKDSRFWVVRPRVSTTDISGLGTLLTGAYIELEPGTGERGVSDFVGLETPPTTSSSVPGRRLVLVANESRSLGPGSPIYYRGFEVGRVESRRLEPGGRRLAFDAFIGEEYMELVRENTKFWNTSGVDITAGADGFRMRTPSFQAMVSGGAAFGIPAGVEPGPPAVDGTVFELWDDAESAERSTFTPTLRYLLLFDQSVRGLSVGAPVEFRGIRIGRVSGISFDYLAASSDFRIPVMVEIDPKLLRAESVATAPSDPLFLESSVNAGLRAALKTGNLLTGALFVDLDYYPDAPRAELSTLDGYTTIPTISAGFAQLEAKLSAVLDKIQALPVDTALEKIAMAAEESALTIAEARNTLRELEATVAAARATLEDPEFQGLPGDLRRTLQELEQSIASVGPKSSLQGDLARTLDELRATLRSLKSMTTTIDERPNSLLFGRESSGNPTPRAPRNR